MTKFLKCKVCGKKDKTVKKRLCGYQSDINDKDVWEVICDNCEGEHLMDI